MGGDRTCWAFLLHKPMVRKRRQTASSVQKSKRKGPEKRQGYHTRRFTRNSFLRQQHDPFMRAQPSGPLKGLSMVASKLCSTSDVCGSPALPVHDHLSRWALYIPGLRSSAGSPVRTFSAGISWASQDCACFPSIWFS